jgi:hypothetical protein
LAPDAARAEANPWPGIAVPVADNALPLDESTTIVVLGNHVQIGADVVGDVSPILDSRRMQRIDGLFTRLKEIREGWRSAHPGGHFPGECNLVLDASTPAVVVKSVFQTAAFAGYPNGSFVVRRAHPGPDGALYGRLTADAQVPGPPPQATEGGLGLVGSARPPSLRGGGAEVNGRLPPEVIQRIVRQHFGGMRLCYENGLKANAKLRGRVSVSFTIGEDGHVSHAAAIDPPNAAPRIPDPRVVSCVVSVFASLEYPAPEGGKVTVVYPINFNPGD